MNISCHDFNQVCCYSNYCESDFKEVDQLMSAMDKGDCTCVIVHVFIKPLLLDTTDCDGQVSFEEFTSYMSKLQMND